MFDRYLDRYLSVFDDQYLGKTHNLWHRASLQLEQMAFDNGLSQQLMRPKPGGGGGLGPGSEYDFEPTNTAQLVNAPTAHQHRTAGKRAHRSTAQNYKRRELYYYWTYHMSIKIHHLSTKCLTSLHGLHIMSVFDSDMTRDVTTRSP